ncbi:hypothetical protein LXL04_037086 [Taraxacum kok-saghyz]
MRRWWPAETLGVAKKRVSSSRKSWMIGEEEAIGVGRRAQKVQGRGRRIVTFRQQLLLHMVYSICLLHPVYSSPYVHALSSFIFVNVYRYIVLELKKKRENKKGRFLLREVSFVHFGKPDNAFQVFDEMQGMRPNPFVLSYTKSKIGRAFLNKVFRRLEGVALVEDSPKASPSSLKDSPTTPSPLAVAKRVGFAENSATSLNKWFAESDEI